MKRSIAKAGYTSHFFEVNSSRLHYLVSSSLDSSPGKIPLVLFPGQTMPVDSYFQVLPALAKHFHVYAVDVHGHGFSSWNPEAYTFNNMGRDMAAFLQQVVARPALVSGNSSGGLIAIWLAANAPDWVVATAAEDPPLFSAEWPRLRDDCYVYGVFKRCVEFLKKPQGRDIAGFFSGLEIPVQGRYTPIKLPLAATALLAGYIRLYRLLSPKGAIDLPLVPPSLRLFVKGLSQYDPDFSAAFVDGRACEEFDHAATLAKVKSPLALLHADWFRHEDYGLVGAMEDQDIERIQELVENLRYRRIETAHSIHQAAPKVFVEEILNFYRELEL